MIKQFLFVGTGGFVGAIARFGVYSLIKRYYNGHVGTFTVNIIGCLIIGGFLYFLEIRQFSSNSVRLFCIVGILGAFTTFSTFGHETFEFMRGGSPGLAFWNVGANLFLGLGAVAAGRFFIKVIIT